MYENIILSMLYRRPAFPPLGKKATPTIAAAFHLSRYPISTVHVGYLWILILANSLQYLSAFYGLIKNTSPHPPCSITIMLIDHVDYSRVQNKPEGKHNLIIKPMLHVLVMKHLFDDCVCRYDVGWDGKL